MRALLPTSLDTKIPSTIVYNDINTIMTIVGSANFSKEKTLNFCAIEFVIVHLFFHLYVDFFNPYLIINYSVTQ